MRDVQAFLKKWILDGWLTEGPQIACRPGEARSFAMCLVCRKVFPHWLASMTAAEAKRRGFIGCTCGGIRIQPVVIPQWKALWWFVVRGWFIRKVICKERLWDPRMPIMWQDLT